MATKKRATLAELKKFANKVRKAGGGNPLDALMPAVPADSSQCIIAKNLNFNCEVGAIGDGYWAMWIDDEVTRDKIAAALRLKPVEQEEIDECPIYGVELPVEIGEVARDFDNFSEAICAPWNSEPRKYEFSIDKKKRNAVARLKEFWPYIDASTKEAYANADFVNDKGELVL